MVCFLFSGWVLQRHLFVPDHPGIQCIDLSVTRFLHICLSLSIYIHIYIYMCVSRSLLRNSIHRHVKMFVCISLFWECNSWDLVMLLPFTFCLALRVFDVTLLMSKSFEPYQRELLLFLPSNYFDKVKKMIYGTSLVVFSFFWGVKFWCSFVWTWAVVELNYNGDQTG